MVRRTLWFTVLVAILVALRAASSGALASPPLSGLDALGSWVHQRDPLSVALAAVRWAAELAAWYLLALSALHLAAATLRIRGALVLADLAATPGTSRLVRNALGVGLVTATAVGGTQAFDRPDGPTASLIRSTPVRPTDQPTAGQPSATGTADMRPDTDRGGTATMTPHRRHHQEAGPAPVPGRSTWRVDRGESFWSIAAEVLEESWQRPPTDREIDPFWRALVDSNRGRLIDLDDPDLIHPGQVFEIPPVPPPTDRDPA